MTTEIKRVSKTILRTVKDVQISDEIVRVLENPQIGGAAKPYGDFGRRKATAKETQTKALDTARSLINAFNWKETIEGDHYWEDVYYRLQRLGNVTNPGRPVRYTTEAVEERETKAS